MKKLLSIIALCALTIMTSCQKEGGKFYITGNITEAKDTMLYLEHLTLTDGAVAIDSVRLDEVGAFTLKGDTIGNPEFYRLRIGSQIINLSIDSTETVTVHASLPKMTLGYTVEGSGNCDTIRLLNLKLAELTSQIERVADNRDMTLQERRNTIDLLIHDYKTDVKLSFIEGRYDCASSYYAIFQLAGNQLIFDPVSDPSDVTWLSAIANAWNEKYPGCPRTENLCNIAIQGRQNTRKRTLEINIDDEKVHETGIIDMGFPDVHGNERRLSQLSDNVVLLDFTAYSLPNTKERTLLLRELYNKYHAQGLEIYQVSVDNDHHFWATMCQQLPWVCVWNSEGINSDMVTLYNVQQLPTWFLIDRGSNLVGRQEFMGNLESEIKKLL